MGAVLRVRGAWAEIRDDWGKTRNKGLGLAGRGKLQKIVNTVEILRNTGEALDSP